MVRKNKAAKAAKGLTDVNTHVDTAELNVCCVLMGRPVLLFALRDGGSFKLPHVILDLTDCEYNGETSNNATRNCGICFEHMFNEKNTKK